MVVLFRGSFQNIRQSSPSLLYGSPPPPPHRAVYTLKLIRHCPPLSVNHKLCDLMDMRLI